jgi:UDP-N-acetylglucosamine--N-acetylmuramyl-(pentapeptide) pyrophosphoryl-undecaprenol N-acetylglucosamine transferase
MSAVTILIAGGATGGHIFPAVAVAEQLRALADVDVVFCGTGGRLEQQVIPSRGFKLERFAVTPIKGRSRIQAARGAAMAVLATLRGLSAIRRLRPRAVLSVGGYASGPVALAAALSGVPVALLEPNSVAGLANRLLAPFAKRAYVAFDEAAPSFRAGSLRKYGVPLRQGFAPKPHPRGGSRSADDVKRILVMGGSQGAASLNELVPQAIARLVARRPSTAVLHQAGRERDQATRQSYIRAGCEQTSVVAFIDDVASAIADADIVVARAGAGTLAEITAIGRAAILVPLPHGADDHQTKNALSLSERGAAVCLTQRDADPMRLADELERLLHDEAARSAMADCSRKLGRPNAARDVATDLLGLAGLASRAQSCSPGQSSAVPSLRHEEGR